MGTTDPKAREFGTAGGGFRISVQGGTFRLEGWGYWPADVASTFTREIEAACRNMVPPVDFSFVASALKPQGDEGQQALRTLMQCLAKANLSSARVAAENILTRMQLVRIASACGAEGRLRFESIPT